MLSGCLHCLPDIFRKCAFHRMLLGIFAFVYLLRNLVSSRSRECFNFEAWDFHYGQEYGPETQSKILEYLDHAYIAGLSLLGGEPMDPKNQRGILSLVEKVKDRFP